MDNPSPARPSPAQQKAENRLLGSWVLRPASVFLCSGAEDQMKKVTTVAHHTWCLTGHPCCRCDCCRCCCCAQGSPVHFDLGFDKRCMWSLFRGTLARNERGEYSMNKQCRRCNSSKIGSQRLSSDNLFLLFNLLGLYLLNIKNWK